MTLKTEKSQSETGVEAEVEERRGSEGVSASSLLFLAVEEAEAGWQGPSQVAYISQGGPPTMRNGGRAVFLAFLLLDSTVSDFMATLRINGLSKA